MHNKIAWCHFYLSYTYMTYIIMIILSPMYKIFETFCAILENAVTWKVRNRNIVTGSILSWHYSRACSVPSLWLHGPKVIQFYGACYQASLMDIKKYMIYDIITIHVLVPVPPKWYDMQVIRFFHEYQDAINAIARIAQLHQCDHNLSQSLHYHQLNDYKGIITCDAIKKCMPQL